jgi:hypothetical protein
MLRVTNHNHRKRPMWGPAYAAPMGWIIRPGSSPYGHRFGGESWAVVDSAPVAAGPTLLLTFDLHDPLFAALALQLDELPLCTYTTHDFAPQLYRIDSRNRRVELLDKKGPSTEVHLAEFTPPFQEQPIRIEPMIESDYPTTKELYWQACENFLGGARFMRVLGPPLWLYAAATIKCVCGRAMEYVCSVGYETQPPLSGLLPNEAICFGEMAIYWMVCRKCQNVAVITQPT